MNKTAKNALIKFAYFIFGMIGKVKLFFYYLNFRKHHFQFRWKDGKLQMAHCDHEQYIQLIQAKLDSLCQLQEGEVFIKSALGEALNGANCIVITRGRDEKDFAQFWVGSKKLEFDFLMIKANGLKKYRYQVLGLLKQYELNNELFAKKANIRIDKATDFEDIKANFGYDVELATQFVEELFKEVFKRNRFRFFAKVI